MKANTASRTAQYMALFRAIETARPDGTRIFNDPYATLFLDSGLRAAVTISSLPLIGNIIPAIVNYRGPGAMSSGIARTRYIDDLLKQAINNDIKQVIILGAGFDTRAERLNFLKAIPVIEIDHPATCAFKIERLKEAGHQPANVSYYQIDFTRQSLNDLAASNGLNFNIPTAIIWEGVCNYLPIDAINKTFEFIRRFTSGSQIIFTYIHQQVLDKPESFYGTARTKQTLRDNEEQWVTGFMPEEMPQYLAKFKLQLLSDCGAKEYREEYIPGRAYNKGYEFYRVAVAEIFN